LTITAIMEAIEKIETYEGFMKSLLHRLYYVPKIVLCPLLSTAGRASTLRKTPMPAADIAQAVRHSQRWSSRRQALVALVLSSMKEQPKSPLSSGVALHPRT
jgi:hypothetical protein